MGRTSLAKKYYEETQEDQEDQESTWLIIYDFKSKPNPRFWTNLNRLTNIHNEGSLIQYSVFKTTHKRVALTAVKLARHYGAEVMIFRGEEINMDQELIEQGHAVRNEKL